MCSNLQEKKYASSKTFDVCLEYTEEQGTLSLARVLALVFFSQKGKRFQQISSLRQRK